MWLVLSCGTEALGSWLFWWGHLNHGSVLTLHYPELVGVGRRRQGLPERLRWPYWCGSWDGLEQGSCLSRWNWQPWRVISPPPPPPPEDQLPVVGTGHTTFPQTVLLSIWLGEFGHFCVPYGGNVGLPFKSLQDGNRLDVLSQCLQVSLLEAAGGALQYSWGKWPLLDQTEMHLVCGNWLLPPCL